MQTREELIHTSILYRGYILHEMTLLERFMDIYIVNYLGKPENNLDFIELMLGNNRISLDGKRKLIEDIFQKIGLNYKTTFPDYGVCMNSALKERNFFAHCTLDMSDTAQSKPKDTIGLYRFGKNAKTHWYNQAYFDKIISDIAKCRGFFDGLSS